MQSYKWVGVHCIDVMSETDDTKIATGYETNNSRIRTTDWEVEAYADDGECAMSWMLRRVDDELIESQAIACDQQTGLRENHGDAEVFDVDPDTTLGEFAEEHANADPELAIEQAREHHN